MKVFNIYGIDEYPNNLEDKIDSISDSKIKRREEFLQKKKLLI